MLFHLKIKIFQFQFFMVKSFVVQASQILLPYNISHHIWYIVLSITNILGRQAFINLTNKNNCYFHLFKITNYIVYLGLYSFKLIQLCFKSAFSSLEQKIQKLLHDAVAALLNQLHSILLCTRSKCEDVYILCLSELGHLFVLIFLTQGILRFYF